MFGKLNTQPLGAGAEKGVRDGGEQAGTIAAGAVGIDTAAVRQLFQSGQRDLNNFVARSSAKASDKTGATRIVVGVAPIRVASPGRPEPHTAGANLASLVPHVRLLNGETIDVQRRISMHCIDFLTKEKPRELPGSWFSKLRDFGEMEVADLHRRHHHFKRLFSGCAHRWTH